MWFELAAAVAVLMAAWLMSGSLIKAATTAIVLGVLAGVVVPMADALAPRLQTMSDHAAVDPATRQARAYVTACRAEPEQRCLDAALARLAALEAASVRPSAGD